MSKVRVRISRVFIRFSARTERPVSTFELSVFDYLKHADGGHVLADRIFNDFALPQSVMIGAFISLLECDGIGADSAGRLYAKGDKPVYPSFMREGGILVYFNHATSTFLSPNAFMELTNLFHNRHRKDTAGTPIENEQVRTHIEVREDVLSEWTPEDFELERHRLADCIKLERDEWLADYSVSSESLLYEFSSADLPNLKAYVQSSIADQSKPQIVGEGVDQASFTSRSYVWPWSPTSLIVGRHKHYEILRDWLAHRDTRYVLICTAHIAGSEGSFNAQRIEIVTAILREAAMRGVQIDVAIGFMPKDNDSASAFGAWQKDVSATHCASNNAKVAVSPCKHESDIKLLYCRDVNGVRRAIVGSFNWLYEDECSEVEPGLADLGICIEDPTTLVSCLDEVLGTFGESPVKDRLRSERSDIAKVASHLGWGIARNVRVRGGQRALVATLARRSIDRFFLASYRCDVGQFQRSEMVQLRNDLRLRDVDQRWMAQICHEENNILQESPADLLQQERLHARLIVSDSTVVIGSQNWLSQFGTRVKQLSLEITAKPIADYLSQYFLVEPDAIVMPPCVDISIPSVRLSGSGVRNEWEDGDIIAASDESIDIVDNSSEQLQEMAALQSPINNLAGQIEDIYATGNLVNVFVGGTPISVHVWSDRI